MARVFHFTLSLRSPLVLRHGTLNYREGLIIELRDESGTTGYGECSPLRGFFSESHEDCKNWLTNHREDLLHIDSALAPPSVRSALDQARLWLKCKQDRRNPVELLKTSIRSLPINALLTGSRGEVLNKAERCASDGFIAAKLKVGRNSVRADLELVNEVRKILPKNLSLRLDANQSWSFDQGLEFSRHIDWEGIEYCEEPLADASQLPRLFDNVPAARIALDESFTSLGVNTLGHFPSPTAIILRPQLCGGIHETRQLISLLTERGIAVVISSAVESSLGMLAVMLCALSTPLPIRPAGLDTLSWLDGDTIIPPLSIEQGRIDWPEWWNQFRINEQVGEWREL